MITTKALISLKILECLGQDSMPRDELYVAYWDATNAINLPPIYDTKLANRERFDYCLDELIVCGQVSSANGELSVTEIGLAFQDAAATELNAYLELEDQHDLSAA